MLNVTYCEAWEAHKAEVREDLENIIKNNHCISSYKQILDSIIKRVLNQNTEENTKFNEEKVTEIDDGDWQGTIIWAIPAATYQPGPYEYIFAYQYYGSCSVCDALQAADDDIDMLMEIALNIFESMKFLWEI